MLSLEDLPEELRYIIGEYLGDFLLIARFCKPFYWKTKGLVSENLYILAARQNSIKLVKWLLGRGCPKFERISSGGYTTPPAIAASKGNLEMMKLFRDHKFPVTQKAMTFAAEFGQIHIMEQLVKWKIYPTEDTTSYAAKGGQLCVFLWLSQHRWLYINQYAKKMAARNGQLHILEWIFGNLPFEFPSSRELRAAAQGGQMHVLEYIWMNARKEDIHKCGPAAMEVALMNGHTNIADWLERMNVKLATGRAQQISILATQNGHTNSIGWIHTRGYAISDKCNCVADSKTKKWLKDNVL